MMSPEGFSREPAKGVVGPEGEEASLNFQTARTGTFRFKGETPLPPIEIQNVPETRSDEARKIESEVLKKMHEDNAFGGSVIDEDALFDAFMASVKLQDGWETVKEIGRRNTVDDEVLKDLDQRMNGPEKVAQLIATFEKARGY